MLTLGTEWKRLMSMDKVKPIFFVQIDIGGGSTEGVNVFSAVSGDEAKEGFPNSIANVSVIDTHINVITRKHGISSLIVTYKDDSFLRWVTTNFKIKNKKVIIKWGPAELPIANFEYYAVQKIDDWIPEHGSIELHVSPGLGDLSKKLPANQEFIRLHPLEVIYSICAQLGISSDYLDYNSLLPNPAINPTFAPFKHFQVCRALNKPAFPTDPYSPLIDPTEAKGLVDDLSSLVCGGLIVEEDGKARFKAYIGDTGAVFTWDKSVIRNFKVISTVENLRNQWKLTSHPSEEGTLEQITGWGDPRRFITAKKRAHTLEDTVSVADYGALPADTLTTDWVTGLAYSIYHDTVNFPSEPDFGVYSLVDTLGPGDYFAVIGYGNTPCGCGYGSDNVRQTWEEPDATHLVYLKVDTGHVSSLGYPIYETISIDDIVVIYPEQYRSNSAKSGSFAEIFSFRIAQRDVFGTGFLADAFKQAGAITEEAGELEPYEIEIQTWVTLFDFTIHFYLLNLLVKRFSNGCQIFSLDTPLSEYDVQIGDIGNIIHDIPVKYGADGVGYAHDFEIIGKKTLKDRIEWVIAYVPSTFTGTVEPTDEESDTPYVAVVENIIANDGSDVLDFANNKLYSL